MGSHPAGGAMKFQSFKNSVKAALIDKKRSTEPCGTRHDELYVEKELEQRWERVDGEILKG